MKKTKAFFRKGSFEASEEMVMEWSKTLKNPNDPHFLEIVSIFSPELEFYDIFLPHEPNEVKIGYFTIFPNEKSIQSFFLSEKYLLELDPKDIFLSLVLNQFDLEKAYVDSSDTFFLNLLLDHVKEIKVVRYSSFECVRKEIKEFHHPMKFKELVVAKEPDFQKIWKLIEPAKNHFLSEMDTKKMISRRTMFMLFLSEDQENENIIGIGAYLESRIFKDNWGIGMFVGPNYRRKSIGTYILNQLQNICIRNGKLALAGCDQENVASRKTLQKSGMVNRGSFMEIKLRKVQKNEEKE